MKCKNCNEKEAIKYSQFSNGEFCCKECSRSYSTKNKRLEIDTKISNSLKEKYKNNEIKKNILHHRTGKKLNVESINKLKKSLKESWAKRIGDMKKNTPLEMWSNREKKVYIFSKYGNKCQECGYSYTDMNGKGPFEIHHIDGNHENWKEENLTVLCLNCHWKTPNWRFRGKKHTEESKKKISEFNLNK